MKARAKGFGIRKGRLRVIITDQGEIACDGAVLAAGFGAGALARDLGDRVPLVAERGYHIVVRDAPVRPGISLMPADGKMAVATTLQGLRLAGQVELADPATPPDWKRARIQLSHALRMFPQAADAIRNGPHDVWMGNRPSTPDGLPVIGRSAACPDIIHAFGHGHTGMAMAPGTAALVADLITGKAPRTDPAPYEARRFNRFV